MKEQEYFETSVSLIRHPLWWLIKILIEPVAKAYGYKVGVSNE